MLMRLGSEPTRLLTGDIFITTLLLDYLPDSTRVINRPSGVRNWNEKLAALVFPDYTPRTIVSSDVTEIKRFAEKEGKITVKPVDGFGGKGIIFYTPGESTESIVPGNPSRSSLGDCPGIPARSHRRR